MWYAPARSRFRVTYQATRAPSILRAQVVARGITSGKLYERDISLIRTSAFTADSTQQDVDDNDPLPEDCETIGARVAAFGTGGVRITRGEFFARPHWRRGGHDFPIAQGYCAQSQSVPLGVHEIATLSGGILQNPLQASEALGADGRSDLVVPSRAIWNVYSLGILYTASATGGGRDIEAWIVNEDGNVQEYLVTSGGAAPTANQTMLLILSSITDSTGKADVNVHKEIGAPFKLGGNFEIRVDDLNDLDNNDTVRFTGSVEQVIDA